jgi:AraC family transcriptional regulator, regulatory protein of adaptative response / DNA-3-methyladenine glycosylase II
MGGILGLGRRALDRARVSRDPRFDGKFFIAVTSTGIYCRPICPSPTSKNANVRYYATAAAAAEAGFRPCLRCRPEAAPGTPAWLGTSAVVRRALRLIEDGILDEGPVDALAARLGIGSRHLHRLFVQHVGASPIAVAQTRRLHFAKRLLDETSLPMTQIALAAGFGSVRRFNDAFRTTYGRAPRELRRQRRGGLAPEAADEVVLRLAYRPPYDWDGVRAFLAAHAVPGAERVDERGYARTVACDGGHALVLVRPIRGEDALELRVRGATPAALFHISSAARRAFDLAADPALIARTLGVDPLLAPLVAARPGLRIAGAWDPFECALGVAVGRPRAETRAFMGDLVARLGRPIDGGCDGLTHLFFTPPALASADVDRLAPVDDARVLQAVARAVIAGAFDPASSVEEAAAALARVPGICDAAAPIVALRALGDPDAFPASDPILRRAAGGGPLTARGLASRAESWRPWRGYAAFHLWHAASETSRASKPRTAPPLVSHDQSALARPA